MKKVTLSTALFLSLVSYTYGAPEQDFLDVMETYKRGEYKSALSGFRMLAEKGDVAAQYNLGVMYLNGQGIEYSYAEALGWFTKAAEQGEVRAQYNVAAMYINGTGIPKDYVRAYKWFSVLAAQGVQAALATVRRLAKLMTSEQLEAGQRLYREWVAAKKGCLTPECGPKVSKAPTGEQPSKTILELPLTRPGLEIPPPKTASETPPTKTATETPPRTTALEIPPTLIERGKQPAKKFQATPSEIPPEPDVTAQGNEVTGSDSILRRLAELEALYKNRLITDEEYRSIRKRILGEQ